MDEILSLVIQDLYINLLSVQTFTMTAPGNLRKDSNNDIWNKEIRMLPQCVRKNMVHMTAPNFSRQSAFTLHA